MTEKDYKDALTEAIKLDRREIASILLKERIDRFLPVEKEI